MSDEVRSMLRAAGWSGFDANGCKIEYWVQNPEGDSVGIVRDRDGRMLLGRTWTADGQCVGYGHDLVGLPSSVPATVAVQDENGPTDEAPVQQIILSGILNAGWSVTPCQGKRMARELIAARKRISELERQSLDVPRHAANDAKTIRELLREINELEVTRDQLEEERDELRERLKSPSVENIQTSGMGLALRQSLDSWVSFGSFERAYKVTDVDVDGGFPMVICGHFAIRLEDLRHTGPTYRGPWRPIQKGGA